MKGRRSGWSLPELLTVAVCLAILSAAIWPMVTGVSANAAYASAVNEANALNQAQQSFKSRNADYADQWSSAADDSARYQLLLPYLPMAPTTFASFPPSGYSFVFGATVDTRVTLNGPTPQTSTY